MPLHHESHPPHNALINFLHLVRCSCRKLAFPRGHCHCVWACMEWKSCTLNPGKRYSKNPTKNAQLNCFIMLSHVLVISYIIYGADSCTMHTPHCYMVWSHRLYSDVLMLISIRYISKISSAFSTFLPSNHCC